MSSINEFFKIKENKSTVATEIIAGLTTYFAMSYIIFVNPNLLSQTGIPWGGVFLATILATVIGTLVMGLYANVPYAVAPGMGLNAFFTYTVVFSLGFSWQEALAMVFICGVFNIIITITNVRKIIIQAIPKTLQNAISGGIGVFIAYIGLKNAGLLQFTFDPGTYTVLDPAREVGASTILGSSRAVPELVAFSEKSILLALIGIILTLILVVKNIKGSILIGILATSIIGIFMGVVDINEAFSSSISIGEAFSQLGQTFGQAFGKNGIISLFSDPTRIPLVIITIFSFSLSDVFDTIGTFIGTGRKSGIFSEEDEKKMMETAGFETKMDKALFADSIATSIGAIFGTSNTTTFVESAAGIGAGGRTGLTSVVTSIMFLLSIFIIPIANLVPAQATAASLIVVGIMMLSSFTEINWENIEEAIPAFFASIFMGLVYSISYGIAFGFFAYILVKVVKGKAKEIHPILWISSILFILNFLIIAFVI